MPCRTNYEALAAFRHQVTAVAALRRRSQTDRNDRGSDRATRRTVAPHAAYHTRGPSTRFAVKHRRWQPYAGNPPVPFCVGVSGIAHPNREYHRLPNMRGRHLLGRGHATGYNRKILRASCPCYLRFFGD
jgi:hypothetical protein